MANWIVFNADDLGVSHSATLGVIKAHREGAVTSASLSVTTPCYGLAVASCVRTCPDLGIGLHFTLTSGMPLSDSPLLTDGRGFFRWRFTSLFSAIVVQRRAALLEQIGRELEAQLDKLASDGIRPDHIDGERHVHLIPGIFELVVAAARRRGIPFVRAGTDIRVRSFPPASLPGLALRGGLAKSWLLSRLARRAQRRLGDGVSSATQVASYLGSGQLDLITRAAVNAPHATGGLEVMVHPGVSEPSETIDLGNPELERYLRSSDRKRELQWCLAARAWVDRSRLTNYTRLAAEHSA